MELIMKRGLMGTVKLIDKSEKNIPQIKNAKKTFKNWSNRLDTTNSVFDFTLQGDKLHIHYFDAKGQNYKEKDITVTIDETIVNDEAVMGNIRMLASNFAANKDERKTAYLKEALGHRRNHMLKDAAINLLQKYATLGKLPTFEDSEYLRGVVKWIDENEEVIKNAKVALLGSKDKKIWKHMNLIDVSSMLLGQAIMIVSSIVRGQINFSPLIIGGAISVLTKVVKEQFKMVKNDKTAVDFLSDIKNYDDEHRTQFDKELNESIFANSFTFMRRFVEDNKDYIVSYPEYNLEALIPQINSLYEKEVNDTIADRFKRMEKLIALEKRIYAKESRIGGKEQVEGPFYGAILLDRISYLGLSCRFIEKDAFLLLLDELLRNLISYPFYGVERVILDILSLAVDYARVVIKYNGEEEKTASSEYAELLRRRVEVERNAYKVLGIVKRRDELFKAKQALVSSTKSGVEENCLPGRQIIALPSKISSTYSN